MTGLTLAKANQFTQKLTFFPLAILVVANLNLMLMKSLKGRITNVIKAKMQTVMNTQKVRNNSTCLSISSHAATVTFKEKFAKLPTGNLRTCTAFARFKTLAFSVLGRCFICSARINLFFG